MISLLDNHPELAVVPLEVKFYDHFYSTYKGQATYKELNELFLYQSKISLIQRGNTDLLDPMNTGYVNFSNVNFSIIEKEMERNVLEKKPGQPDRSIISEYIIDFHHAYALAIDSPVTKGFAIKEGNHGLPYINKIKYDFRDAKFIVMIRDPRDMYASLKAIGKLNEKGKEYKSFANSMPVMQYLFDKEKRGKGIGDYMKYFQGSSDHQKFMFVRYEDLVQNAEDVMKGVAGFLGINYNPCLLIPTVAGRLWHGNSSNEKQFSNINSSRVSKWSQELSESEVMLIEYFLKDYFEKWNYQRKYLNLSAARCLSSSTFVDIAGRFPHSWKDYLRPFYKTFRYFFEALYYFSKFFINST